MITISLYSQNRTDDFIRFQFSCSISNLDLEIPSSKYINPLGKLPYRYPFQLANFFRRILMEEIPVLAIDSVEIIKNDSYLPNEFLSSRLGLIPLKCDNLDLLNMSCSCSDYCSQCSKIFRLNISLNNNTTYEILSSDLISDDSDTYPVSSNIKILTLFPYQCIILNAIATKNIAKNHVKWSPVSQVSYSFSQDNINTSDFIFDLESIGSLKAIDILLQGIDILKQKLPILQVELKDC